LWPLGHLYVHLGDQRAGGIKDMKTTRFGLLLHGLAHAVGAEHQRGAGRHIGERFNEDCAFGLEIVHHIGVVDDFMAHVNRRAKLAQGPLNDFNGPVHAGAKAARLCK
jgi:hypothetical protein